MSEEIYPGMGATIYLRSDRYAATVESVSPTGKTISVRRDGTRRQAGVSVLFPVEQARQAPDGTWRIGGRRGKMVTFGKRDPYLDPDF